MREEPSLETAILDAPSPVNLNLEAADAGRRAKRAKLERARNAATRDVREALESVISRLECQAQLEQEAAYYGQQLAQPWRCPAGLRLKSRFRLVSGRS